MSVVKEKITENKNKGKKFNVPCPKCKGLTRHSVVVDALKSGEEVNRQEEWSVDWWHDYQVIECQGCGTISFRHWSWFSEDRDIDSDGTFERLYPKREVGSLPAKDFLNAPNVLRRIYRETIEAFNNECLTLCAAGLRSIVEGICAEQGVVDGPVTVDAPRGKEIVRRNNLEGKIGGLFEKGILTKRTADTLHEHRYLGNEAVHQLSRPSADELKLAVEIIEHTIEQLYDIPEKAIRLREKAAARKSGKK